MTYHTGTITQIHRQLNEDGYRVSKNTLRAWVKQRILPAAYNGKKAYINYDNVIHILTTGASGQPTNTTDDGIRRINS